MRIIERDISTYIDKLLIVSITISFVTGCREKFYADLSSPATGYLVVEGIINIGIQALTTIKLSRTSPLDDRDIHFEDDGRVYIEDVVGTTYELQHTDSGRFVSQPLSLAAGKEYRIHVFTQGREYYSGFTEGKISPEIDSLFWAPKPDGIEIQLNTQDPSGRSRYYHWSFIETWQYTARYYTNLKWDSTLGVVPRGPADPEIYNCWMTMPSTTVAIGSTIKLSKDFLYAQPVAYVSASSTNKLVEKYSILVRQSVITAEAYEYLDRVRKNTEQTGSIFDRQPSALTGNIYCTTDTSEAVMGFITASSITEKRFFVDRTEIPPMRIKTFYEDCREDTVKIPLTVELLFPNLYYVPTVYVSVPIDGGTSIELLFSDRFCVDCRKLGGSNQKPSFWP